MVLSESLSLAEQGDLARCTLARASKALPRLVAGPLAELGALLFLLHDDTTLFLRQDAPRLASLLRRRSERVTLAQAGVIRGRIDWPATTKAQQALSSAYVCRVSQPNYDQLENQYFHFVLHRIRHCIHLMGNEEHPLSWGTESLPVHRKVSALRGNWEQVQRILPAGKVTLPHQMTPAHERAVRHVKQAEYQTLPAMWTLYRQFLIVPDPEIWHKALTKSMPYSSRWSAYHQEETSKNKDSFHVNTG